MHSKVLVTLNLVLTAGGGGGAGPWVLGVVFKGDPECVLHVIKHMR